MTTKEIIRFDWVKRPEAPIGDWCVEIIVGTTALGRPDIDGPMTPEQAAERHGIALPDAIAAINTSAMARAEMAEAALVKAESDAVALRQTIRARERQIEILQQLRSHAAQAIRTGDDEDAEMLKSTLAELDRRDKADRLAAKGSRIEHLEAELALLRSSQ